MPCKGELDRLDGHSPGGRGAAPRPFGVCSSGADGVVAGCAASGCCVTVAVEGPADAKLADDVLEDESDAGASASAGAAAGLVAEVTVNVMLTAVVPLQRIPLRVADIEAQTVRADADAVDPAAIELVDRLAGVDREPNLRRPAWCR